MTLEVTSVGISMAFVAGKDGLAEGNHLAACIHSGDGASTLDAIRGIGERLDWVSTIAVDASELKDNQYHHATRATSGPVPGVPTMDSG